MDNFEMNVFDKVKSKIAISKFEVEEKGLKNSSNKIKKSVVAASVIILSTAGIVFAKDIENYISNLITLRSRHQIAVDNGYVPDFEMDFIKQNADVTIGNSDKVLDNAETNLKVNDFMITDDYFEFEMEMNFSKNINKFKDLNKRVGENIDYENFGSIELRDFFVVDEENRIIVAPGFLDANEKVFNDFCAKHNLNYTYQEYNANYIDMGGVSIQSSPETIIPEENGLQNIIFRVNSFGEKIPKSKHLTMYFNKIVFIPKDMIGDGSDEVYLNGEWKIELDIPEVMQNREDYIYKVVSCDNKNFEILGATADETDFELSFNIKNIQPVNYPQECFEIEEKVSKENGGSYSLEMTKEGLLNFYGSEELVKLYEQNHTDNYVILDRNAVENYYWLKDMEPSYLLDSNGNKYDTKRTEGNFKYDITYDENGFSNTTYRDEYEGSVRCMLTKYDITDKITVVLNVKGELVTIELERVK